MNEQSFFAVTTAVAQYREKTEKKTDVDISMKFLWLFTKWYLLAWLCFVPSALPPPYPLRSPATFPRPSLHTHNECRVYRPSARPFVCQPFVYSLTWVVPLESSENLV